MTRRVSFSSGHRYWFASLSDSENRDRFGRWASPFNHGHNYVLDVTVAGQVDPNTGMVVNIKRVDDALKSHVLAEFDQRSINDEIPHFANRSSSLENLLEYLWEKLSSESTLPAPAQLIHLRLEETPLLWGERNDQGMTTLTRTYEFAASHRLHAPHLPQAENERLYGKCNHAAGHGHNYLLEVTVGGTPDPDSGMLIDLETLDAIVKREILDRYDHRNLDVDVAELHGRITTSEVVVGAIRDRLKPVLPLLCRVRLHETARNIFEVSA